MGEYAPYLAVLGLSFSPDGQSVIAVTEIFTGSWFGADRLEGGFDIDLPFGSVNVVHCPMWNCLRQRDEVKP